MGRGARFVNRPAREGRQARTIARVHCADVGRVDPSLRGLTAAGAGVVGRVRPGSAWADRADRARADTATLGRHGPCGSKPADGQGGRAAGRRCAAPRARMAGAGQLGRENSSSTCRYTNGSRPPPPNDGCVHYAGHVFLPSAHLQAPAPQWRASPLLSCQPSGGLRRPRHSAQRRARLCGE